MRFSQEYWKESNSKVEFIPTTTIDPNYIVTAVKIYAVEEGRLLLTRVGRGWDLPGGHIEPGESPLEAIVREIKEETGGVVQHIRLVGVVKVTNEDATPESRYPHIGYMAIFKGTGIKLSKKPDLSAFEAIDRKLIPFEEVDQYHHYWSSMKREILKFIVK